MHGCTHCRFLWYSSKFTIFASVKMSVRMFCTLARCLPPESRSHAYLLFWYVSNILLGDKMDATRRSRVCCEN